MVCQLVCHVVYQRYVMWYTNGMSVGIPNVYQTYKKIWKCQAKFQSIKNYLKIFEMAIDIVQSMWYDVIVQKGKPKTNIDKWIFMV